MCMRLCCRGCRPGSEVHTHKKAQTQPYLCQACDSLKCTMVKSAHKTQLQRTFDFARKISFEVAVRQRIEQI